VNARFFPCEFRLMNRKLSISKIKIIKGWNQSGCFPYMDFGKMAR